MKAVFFVLNDSAKFKELLKKLNLAGIYGTTIFNAGGMGSELCKIDDFSQNFGLLRRVIEGTKQEHKVFMFVIGEDRIPLLIETIESVTGCLENEGSGILFTLPIDFVKGIKY